MLCGVLNGKKSKWEGINVYVSLIHYAVKRKPTQHFKAITLQKYYLKIFFK